MTNRCRPVRPNELDRFAIIRGLDDRRQVRAPGIVCVRSYMRCRLARASTPGGESFRCYTVKHAVGSTRLLSVASRPHHAIDP